MSEQNGIVKSLIKNFKAIDKNVSLLMALMFLILVNHSVLETSRNSLFIQGLSAKNLPWVYIGIAFFTLLATRFNQWLDFRFTTKKTLLLTLMTAALINLAFYFLITNAGLWVIWALYLWTGVLVTLVMAQFWLLVSNSYTATQAKKFYGFITLGGLAGATSGSFLSAYLLNWVSEPFLLIAGALILGLASATVPLLSLSEQNSTSLDDDDESESNDNSPISIFEGLKNKYVFSLAIIVLLSAMASTSLDFIAKQLIEEKVESQSLGQFFGFFFGSLNLLSMALQIFISTNILNRIGIIKTLSFLPAGIFMGSAALLFLGGIWPALAIKSIDGALRHSIHRTASEFLFIPLKKNLRVFSKIFIDSFFSRFGQALSSIIILLVLANSFSTDILHIFLFVLSGLWLFFVIRIRNPYFDQFRSQLVSGQLHLQKIQLDLDLKSLEIVLTSLNSRDSNIVLYALETLEKAKKQKLIPNLLIRHSDPRVVLRCLEIFDHSRRKNHLEELPALLDSKNSKIQVATARSLAKFAKKNGDLSRLLSSKNRAVKINGFVAATSIGAKPDYKIAELLAPEDDSEIHWRIELLEAIYHFEAIEHFSDFIDECIDGDDLALHRKVVEVISINPSRLQIAFLIEMLRDRYSRSKAREALLRIGSEVLPLLEECLRNKEVSESIRIHIPRTICRFKSQRSVNILIKYLENEIDTRVGFKIIKGLGQLNKNTRDLIYNEKDLDLILELLFKRLLQLNIWHDGLAAISTKLNYTEKNEIAILLQLIFERQGNIIERIFRILDLLHPGQNIELLHKSLQANNEHKYSVSLEVLTDYLDYRSNEMISKYFDQKNSEEKEKVEEEHSIQDINEFSRDFSLLLIDQNLALRTLSNSMRPLVESFS